MSDTEKARSYEEILADVREMRVLSSRQMRTIRTLSLDQLYAIIDLYNVTVCISKKNVSCQNRT